MADPVKKHECKDHTLSPYEERALAEQEEMDRAEELDEIRFISLAIMSMPILGILAYWILK